MVSRSRGLAGGYTLTAQFTGNGDVLVFHTNNTHFFAFAPSDSPRRRNMRSRELGLAARHRVGPNLWRYVSARVYWPCRDLRVGRGTVSAELSTFKIRGDWGQDRVRDGMKTFVRVKIGLGGSRA